MEEANEVQQGSGAGDREVEARVSEDGAETPAAQATVFDMRGQHVDHQVNVAGNYVDRRSTVIVGDGNVVGDRSSSHVVKGCSPAPERVPGSEWEEDVVSLRRQLAEARVNLRLIEERESSYVLSTDVPLQLVKEKQRLQRAIADLEARLADTFPKA